MARKNWLWAVIGLGLVACGGGSDDGDDDTMNPATGNTSGGTSGGTGAAPTGGTTGGTGGTTGGTTTGGSTGASTGGTTGMTCPQPPVQQCMCPSGAMGIQTCMNGVFGDCMCIEGVDAGPERACPSTAMCQMVGLPGLPPAVCVTAGGGGPVALPPMCTTDADCATAGFMDVSCMSIGGFASFCVQACTP